MGSWFSDMHIRKNDHVSAGAIDEYIQKVMAEQKYRKKEMLHIEDYD